MRKYAGTKACWCEKRAGTKECWREKRAGVKVLTLPVASSWQSHKTVWLVLAFCWQTVPFLDENDYLKAMGLPMPGAGGPIPYPGTNKGKGKGKRPKGKAVWGPTCLFLTYAPTLTTQVLR